MNLKKGKKYSDKGKFGSHLESWSVNLVWNYLDVKEEDFLSSEINLEFKYRHY